MQALGSSSGACAYGPHAHAQGEAGQNEEADHNTFHGDSRNEGVRPQGAPLLAGDVRCPPNRAVAVSVTFSNTTVCCSPVRRSRIVADRRASSLSPMTTTSRAPRPSACFIWLFRDRLPKAMST